jgi:acyl-CoA hydrolase
MNACSRRNPSWPTSAEWVAPDIADEQGYLRAGKILEWMDVVGVLAATRDCRRPVVTASVDGMELANPIRVGERVTMTASVAHTSELECAGDEDAALYHDVEQRRALQRRLRVVG